LAGVLRHLVFQGGKIVADPNIAAIQLQRRAEFLQRRLKFILFDFLPGECAVRDFIIRGLSGELLQLFQPLFVIFRDARHDFCDDGARISFGKWRDRHRDIVRAERQRGRAGRHERGLRCSLAGGGLGCGALR
jgi:hypothetical protein